MGLALTLKVASENGPPSDGKYSQKGDRGDGEIP